MKRNLARLILILAVIAWAIIVVSLLVTPVNADSAPGEEPKEDETAIKVWPELITGVGSPFH